ncbi:microfibril-associated glycoprotein 4-like isoform X1 [Onychostoma macrolepis]|uniref:microfibril-associated glycoprotein 4-like isoform X1 n=1 Tax=Onychostoma macrolepis TaxID=369639 RepID=UPI00272B5314|nr:microfibril-associated glycoprotein 4-like isoform X1 [Onychostoma macrolepis]XP_058625883.1 microfibril-associated glycoprotein 4-like isoform X1 [Onychostoma macrolepis]
MAMIVFLVILLVVFLMSGCSQNVDKPVDCSDVYNSGKTVSGIYSIYPAGDIPVWVYCQMISDGNDEDKGGWTVIQRRMDGSVNFYQAWHQYKRGFGNMESEYWLGLDNMYQLTRNRNYKLRVDLEDFQGNKVFAQYSSFSVGPEADGYILHVSGFTDGGAGDSLSVHNGFMFSTFDKDQDSSSHNCAKKYLGAFWYMSCHHTNPNDTLTAEVEATAGGDMLNCDVGGDAITNSPAKCPRRLARYRAHKHQSYSAKDSNIQTLYQSLLYMLSIPASSAPVERVFSKGGIIMRPHRARLTHKMVTELVFLKSNMALI